MNDLELLIRDYLLYRGLIEEGQLFNYYLNRSECVDVIWYKESIRYDKRIATLDLIAWAYGRLKFHETEGHID